MEKNNSQKAFALLELLIAGAVIAIAFTAIATFLLFSRAATLKSKNTSEANSLAAEAIEAVRKLRDDGWTANIVTLTNGTVYYPTVSANQWTLTTTNPSPSSYYTTKIVLSAVNRDSNDDIAASGTNDPKSRKVVVSVSWNNSGSKKVSLTTYITDFNNN